MKTTYKLNIFAAALLLGFALVATTQAQTLKECDAKDKDCAKIEKETANANTNEAKPSGTDATVKTVNSVPDSSGLGVMTGARFRVKGGIQTFVPDSLSFAVKTAAINPAYQAKPTPTPTPDEQTAAPAKPPSNGSNPAELITRVEMKYQFQNFAPGYLHGVPVIRGDYAFTPTVSFRLDLPILTFDPKAPGAKSDTGIGDIVTSMTFVKIFSKKFVGAFVPRIDFPTASYSSLGSGKYAFKPLLAGVTPLGKGLAFVGVLEYHVSFAGNKNRSDINELHIKPIILKSFLSGGLKGYYVNPKAEIIIDFEHDNNGTLQAGAEFGKALNKNVVLFAIPTIHVAGTKRESFKLEVGFRYLFR